VHTRPLEQRVHQRGHRLGADPGPLPVRPDREADHRQGAAVVQPDGHVAGQLAAVVHGDLHPVAPHRTGHRPLGRHERLGGAPAHRQVPALVPGDLGIVAVPGERLGVGGGERAQRQPRGTHRQQPTVNHAAKSDRIPTPYRADHDGLGRFERSNRPKPS
jgi:hypothetical protein